MAVLKILLLSLGLSAALLAGSYCVRVVLGLCLYLAAANGSSSSFWVFLRKCFPGIANQVDKTRSSFPPDALPRADVRVMRGARRTVRDLAWIMGCYGERLWERRERILECSFLNSKAPPQLRPALGAAWSLTSEHSILPHSPYLRT